MIAILQRCKNANVRVENRVVGEIEKGILVFLGIHKDDNKNDAEFLAKKILTLRIFNDKNDKMNLSVQQIKGEILVVSQFTLCGSTTKGRRPSFKNAASAKKSKALYGYLINFLKEKRISVQSGQFGANMDVKLLNLGPVTFILDSTRRNN